MALTPLESAARERTRERKPSVVAKMERYAEKLARNESIAMIQLQYRYGCNIECQHCSISGFQGRRPVGAKFLTPEKVRAIYEEAHALGHAQTTISGGEPLIFKDLFKVIEAINPERFFIQIDTNGWYLTEQKARDLYAAGVDKIQVSLDSSIAAEHDAFRRAPGAYERAVAGIANAKAAGLAVVLATVVTRQRIYTQEWRDFLNWARDMDYPVAYLWPKLTGEWEGAGDALPLPEDLAYMKAMADEYGLRDRTSPWFGLDVGCNAMKRSITITDIGDVLACHWMYFSFGNVWQEALGDITARGMQYFGPRTDTCRVSQDANFITKYIHPTFGRTSTDPLLLATDVLGSVEDFHAHEVMPVGSEKAKQLPPLGRRLPVLEAV